MYEEINEAGDELNEKLSSLDEKLTFLLEYLGEDYCASKQANKSITNPSSTSSQNEAMDSNAVVSPGLITEAVIFSSLLLIIIISGVACWCKFCDEKDKAEMNAAYLEEENKQNNKRISTVTGHAKSITMQNSTAQVEIL